MRFSGIFFVAASLLALAMSACGPVDPTPADDLHVNAIYPMGWLSSGEIPEHVLTNTAFVIEFNQNVDPNTVTPESISLSAADVLGNDVSTTATAAPQLYGDRYVLVAPSAVLQGQSYYNFHVTSAVRSETGITANVLKQTIKTATTGDQIFHVVVSSYKTPSGTNVVGCGEEITIRFSNVVDPRTLDENSVVVTRDSDNARASYEVQFSGYSAIVRPNSSGNGGWEPGKTFTLTLDMNRVSNLWGLKLLSGGAGPVYHFSSQQQCN